jgi:hypothetical protein
MATNSEDRKIACIMGHASIAEVAEHLDRSSCEKRVATPRAPANGGCAIILVQ